MLKIILGIVALYLALREDVFLAGILILVALAI